MITTMAARPARRSELQATRYDVLVIGGGILGTAVTWTAAQAGLRVAMVDAGDFAGATSSASTKLIHGGLRYLQTGNIRLVAENHRERRILAESVAPHLVKPLEFVVPVYEGGPHGAAKLAAGVFLYSALSSFGDGVGRLITARQAAVRVPPLKTAGLRAAAVYRDHQMNDSRVAIMAVQAAVTSGADVFNHAEVVGLRVTHGRITGAELRDRADGTEFGIDAGLVLNATGPWTDHIRRMEDPNAAPSIRLSKGAHMIMRQAEPWRAALTTPIDRHRVSFAIPWEGHLLLGTTDEEYDGDPSEVSADDKDAARILDEASSALSSYQLRRQDITYAFACARSPTIPAALPRPGERQSSAAAPAACSRWRAANGPPSGISGKLSWTRSQNCPATRSAANSRRHPERFPCPASRARRLSRTVSRTPQSGTRGRGSILRSPSTWQPTTAPLPSTSAD